MNKSLKIIGGNYGSSGTVRVVGNYLVIEAVASACYPLGEITAIERSTNTDWWHRHGAIIRLPHSLLVEVRGSVRKIEELVSDLGSVNAKPIGAVRSEKASIGARGL